MGIEPFSGSERQRELDDKGLTLCPCGAEIDAWKTMCDPCFEAETKRRAQEAIRNAAGYRYHDLSGAVSELLISIGTGDKPVGPKLRAVVDLLPDDAPATVAWNDFWSRLKENDRDYEKTPFRTADGLEFPWDDNA